MADVRKNTIHILDITGYTAEGMGVARLEGRVVFVPYTISGERWRVRLEKVNKNVAWGRGIELLLPSPERITPDCPLYGKCGGCQFRHMAYAEELRAKGQRIADALVRVGHVKLDLPPVMGEEKDSLYSIKGNIPSPKDYPEGCRFSPRCEKACQRCHKERPPLFDLPDGRRVRCWNYEGGKTDV